jgi:hypothetical protein
MKAVYDTIDEDDKAGGEFVVVSVDEAKQKSKEWTNGVGCTAVLEVGQGCVCPSRRFHPTNCVIYALGGGQYECP